MKKFFLFFVLTLTALTSSGLEAKLLDKIAAIVDDNIVTLSQIKRNSKIINLKRSLAPNVYEDTNYTIDQLTALSINKFLIRSKLNEMGNNLNDDQIESQIKSNEKKQNIERKSLLAYLKEQNVADDEYFETIREAMEYSMFGSRVILPTISISEQEVKNTYFKNNVNDARLNFKYTVIDYAISKSNLPNATYEQMEEVIRQYRINSILPETFSTLTTTTLEDISEEGITIELKKLLKKTDEGALSSVIMLDNQYHVFYVVKKDLTESENFIKEKDQIHDQLLNIAIKKEIELWFEREKTKHYIKIST